MNYQINLLRSSKKTVGNEPHFWHALLLIIICCTFEALPNKKISEDNTRIEFYERRIKKKSRDPIIFLLSYDLSYQYFWTHNAINYAKFPLTFLPDYLEDQKKKKKKNYLLQHLFSLFLKHRNNFFTLQYESLQVTLKKKQNCLQL